MKLTYTLIQLPTFEQLREPPKTKTEGFWIVGMVFLIVGIYLTKQVLDTRLEQLKEQFKARLAEDKAELLQRDAMVSYLMEQNKLLIGENIVLRSGCTTPHRNPHSLTTTPNQPGDIA